MTPPARPSCSRSRFVHAWTTAGLAAAALLLPTACSEPEVPKAEITPLSVKTLVVSGGGAGSTTEYAGQVAAWKQADMAFEVAGRVTEFRVIEGQEVEKGEVLARLDPRDYQADLAEAEANLSRFKADYERYQKLFEAGVAPEAQLEQRKRAYDVSIARLAQARKAVEDADLVAPFAGEVARKLVEDFVNVRAKEVILILQDTTRFKVRLTVPEADLVTGDTELTLEELNERLHPEVILSSLPGRTFDAELFELATTADPVTRTFDATVLLEPPPGLNVMSGMTAKVVIHRLSADSSLQLPGTSVWADESGAAHVWRVDPETSTVSRAAVKTGVLSGDRIEILSGLEDGDTVATSGVQQLTDGAPIRSLGERIR